MSDRKYIDITPTWEQVMPGYLRVLESGTDEGKALARQALMDLARHVDHANSLSVND